MRASRRHIGIPLRGVAMLKAAVIALILVVIPVLAGCSRGTTVDAPYPDPAKYEIRGIDISAHNGEPDFERVRSQGYEFVYIKATEGGNFRDRRFISNLQNARRAGLKAGAYHFFRFDTPGYLQGLNLADAIEGRTLDLPVVIDLEEWANPNLQATALVLNRLDEMIDHLESRGYRVVLYTNKNGYNRFLRTHSRRYPVWICSLAREPEDVEWVLWQASHSGKVDGIDHPVDLNAFNGTREEWERFIAGDAQ